MNKKLVALPFSAIMSLGLVGCGTNDESAAQDRYTDQAQPIGYYSNENHRNRGGNAQILDGADNDGPFTEMMDHTFGMEGQNGRTNRPNTYDGVNTRNVNNNQNDGQGNHLFSEDDANYHSHLGNNMRKAKNSYYEAYHGKLVENINRAAASVNNVNDVQTVVNGEHVIIAANIQDANRKSETVAAIGQAVQPYLNGRTSKVVTDESTYNRLKVIDNDLRDGGPKDQLYVDVKNLFRNLTD
ncbi:YhcN/YlaJ family sporulation lipoprotein [Cytobacillus sp. FJAT-53684]|uniref:YhcN/YlaJ family sporulation lipoprotein n=1 Tax=Cytobacillus mangrovibacter TaxID=3299024 RepID=A0ABW6JYD0_9BACI